MLATGLACHLLVAFASAAPPAPNDRVVLDRVVAVVDNAVILESELRKAADRHPLMQEALQQLPANASAAAQSQKRREVESKVLQELVDFALLRGQADKFEITVVEGEVDRAMQDIAQQNGLSVEDLKSQVEQSAEYGSWPQYRDELRDQILIYKVSRMLSNWSVSDAQVREHYRKLTRDESAKVKLEQFVFQPASAEPAARDRAFTQAQQVARLLREGHDPATVAQQVAGQVSQQPGGASDVWNTREAGRGELAPVLEDAVFAAPEGSIVGPLGSGQGYVVFKVTDHIESAALSFDEAKDRIRAQLEQEAYMKAEQDLRDQLRAKAHIDIRL